MDGKNSVSKRSVGSIAVVALLLMGIVAVIPLTTGRAFAQTGTTITTSADSNGGKFFGPAILEVLINVSSHASDTSQGTLPVTVTAFGASNTYQVTETGTTSGLFLLYIKVDPTAADADAPTTPATPFSTTNTRLYIGPSGTAATYPATSGGSTNAALVATSVTKGGSVQIAANGVTKTITWDETSATLTLDRTAYGAANTIIAQIKDQDANLDPTRADTITETLPNTLLASGGDAPTATVSFTETGPNTGVFENTGLTTAALGAGVDSAARSLTANDYQAFSESGGIVTPNDASTSYTGVLTTGVKGTSSASYTVNNIKGQFQSVPTPTYASELPLKVNDLDQNTNSRSQQLLTGPVRVTISDLTSGPGSSAAPLLFNLKEDGLNSNTLVPNYAGNDIDLTPGAPSSINAGADQASGTLKIQPGHDVVVEYLDPSQSNTVQSTITFQMSNTAPTLQVDKTSASKGAILRYNMTDPDLNDDSGVIESYTVTFPATAAGTDFGTNTSTNVKVINSNSAPLFDARIRVSGATKALTTPFTLTFVETGPNTGVFTATMNLQTFLTAIGGGFQFSDGDNVELTIKDVMDQTQSVFPEVSQTTQLGLGKPTVDVDRTTLGVPRNGGLATVTDSGVIVGPAFSNLGPQIFHVTINDPSANANAQIQETLVPTVASGSGVTSTSGVLMLSSTGASNTATTGKIRLSLLKSDGTAFTGAGTIAVSKAIKETGFDTGVFSGEIQVFFNPTDAPSQWIGSKLKIEYAGQDNTFGNSDDGDTKSVGFTARNAIMTTNSTVVTNGKPLSITVRDDDANRDATTAEQVSVAIRWVDEDGATKNLADTLDETGPNTGVFTTTKIIGTDTWGGAVLRVSPDQDFRLRYYDLTPNLAGSTSWAAATSTATQIDLTLRTGSATGGLVVEPAKVGPATQIKVTVTDNDENTNPSSKQTIRGRVTAVSDRGAASRADLNVDETGPNTALFTGKVRLNPAQAAGAANSPSNDVTLNALPGDLVSVRYEDQKGANGQRTTVTKTVQVVSQDPVMNFSKTGYTVGDTAELTINDLDANRDPDTADILTIHAWSTTDAVGLTNVQAIETGANTGVFKAIIPTSNTFSTGVLQVRNGDNVTVEYEDAFPAAFRQKFDNNGTLAGSTQKFRVNTVIGSAGTTGSTTPSTPALADITGATITEVTTGQQVVLTTSVKNNDDQPRPFVAIVEVRDADGITQMLQWQIGTLAANDDAGVGISWVPENAGTYEVRTFVISSLQNPQVLSEVVTTNVNVS
jgi:hypothetical protein